MMAEAGAAGRVEDGFAELERVLLDDPGGRGLADLVVPGDLAGASEILLRAESPAIVTGFFIPDAGAAETDGPPGALALGRAISVLGRQTTFVTDEACRPVLEKAGLVPLVVSDGSHEGWDADCLVAVERPGRAADGRYYSMRGRDLTPWTAPLDGWFLSPGPRWRTIAVGDGGNEIGMGKAPGGAERRAPTGQRIASIVPADRLVVAGVSNWGAWGLLAGVSLLAGRRLLPTEDEARADHEAVFAAGAVDGKSGRAAPTVDGLDWSVHAAVRARLDAVVRGVLGPAPT